MSRFHFNKIASLALLGVLLLALFARPISILAQRGEILEQIRQRALRSGSYRFTADIEQTLIPRPVPSMIGQGDERVDMRVEGEVRLPDYAIMHIFVEGLAGQADPITLIQEGDQTFVQSGDERIPTENPTHVAAPTNDFLGYLAAAENIQYPISSLQPPTSGSISVGLA